MLQRNFQKIEEVYTHVFKPGSKTKRLDENGKPNADHKPGWKNNLERLKLAVSTGLTLDKGLGVLVDKSENVTKVDVFTQQREDQQARIQAAKQFGLDPGKEIKQVENSASIDSKEDKGE